MPVLGCSSHGPLWESTSESSVREDLGPLRNIPTDVAFKIYVAFKILLLRSVLKLL